MRSPYRFLILLALGVAMVMSCAAAQLGEPKDVTFTAKLDGSTQRYVLLMPEPFDAAVEHHLLIALHGHGSDRWQYAKDARDECRAARDLAAQYGMLYVSPDYRAATSWMGPAAEADVLQIIADLKQQYKIGKVFLVGASMGGTSVLTFTALHPELIAGVCAQNPHANHLEYANFQDAIAASFGGSKTALLAEYKKRSAEYWPEAFTMPVAITTGGRDTLVPPQSALRLAQVLQALGRKALAIHREEGGHATNYADTTQALDFVIRTALGLDIAQPTKDGGLFFAGAKPAIPSSAGMVELGLQCTTTSAGTLTAFYYYKANGEIGASHTLRLWNAAGEKVFEIDSAQETAEGWQTVRLPKPFAVKAAEMYTLSYTVRAQYPATPDAFTVPIIRSGINAVAGVYSFENLGTAMPGKTHRQMSYGLDIDFVPAK
ncbi:MAG TPA: alpha/beta fold hydrolase [Armatimonadota bacterium]|jgi:acetyl esterase/lipase